MERDTGMKLPFIRRENVIVKSEIDHLELDWAIFNDSKTHVFVLHNDAIFNIEENEQGVMIAGRQYTKQQAIEQLSNVAQGLLSIVENIKRK
jgi:hypothetical protein